MRLLGVALLTLMVAVLINSWGWAADADGFYLGGEGGWNHLDEKGSFGEASIGPIPLPGGEAAQDVFGDGFLAGGRAGYEFGPWRFEGEVALRYNPLARQLILSTVVSPPVQIATNPATGDRRSIALMANVLYDFDFGWPISPYLGLGGGVLLIHQFTGVGNYTITDSSDTEPAGQVIVGVRYEINRAFAIDLDARFLMADNGRFERTMGGTFLDKNQTESVVLSLVYRFDAAPPTPAAVRRVEIAAH
jgi:OOP family OmpA-OmpF porin